MNNRLLDIIKYKTGGRQRVFAEILGWTPQYLTKLLRGENFGLQPVLRLLETLPEINARWLLLGEGAMLRDDKVMGLRRDVYSRVQRFLDMERFMCVMSPEELREFEQVLVGGSYPNFSDEVVERWESLLAERNSKIEDALAKSTTSCRPPKAKQ